MKNNIIEDVAVAEVNKRRTAAYENIAEEVPVAKISVAEVFVKGCSLKSCTRRRVDRQNIRNKIK